MINELYFCVRHLYVQYNPSVTKSSLLNNIFTNNITIYIIIKICTGTHNSLDNLSICNFFSLP